MKCIHCGGDTPYKERQINGIRCTSCRHPFAFEPKRDRLGGIPLTDPLFQKAIKDVSAEGSLAFTEHQLWYEVCRKVSRRFPGCSPGCATSVLGTAAVAALSLGALTLLPGYWRGLALVPALAITAGKGKTRRRTRPLPIRFHEFSLFFRHWVKAHGQPPLLVRPEARELRPSKQWTEADLTAYSFDRALITERDDIAAMLIANRFHFENNCAILSLQRYPHDIAEVVLTMLRRNPQLQVFALHDASVEGCRLPLTLRSPEWFAEPQTQIIDLGLRPAHAQALGLFADRLARQDVLGALRNVLSPEDTEWLEKGNRADLSGLRPAKLMRAIYQGFARATQFGGDAGAVGGVYVDGGPIWIHDGGADVYAADSFG